MFKRLILALVTALSSGSLALAQTSPTPCDSFENCLRMTLKSPQPLERAFYASHGIQFWKKGIPQRDLYNLLMMRADALIRIHLASANENLLKQAEADYQQMMIMRPEDFIPLTGLARLAELHDQLPVADSYYADAVKSGDPVAFLERAESMLRRQQAELALKDLDSAMELVRQLQAREREVHPQHLLRMHQLRVLALTALQRGDELTAALKTACTAGDKRACIQARRRERWGFF